ncbi:MAG: hypothetical protein RLZZ77_1783 [Bacteroidota bacterium]|jgi:hypothetical protein
MFLSLLLIFGCKRSIDEVSNFEFDSRIVQNDGVWDTFNSQDLRLYGVSKYATGNRILFTEDGLIVRIVDYAAAPELSNIEGPGYQFATGLLYDSYVDSLRIYYQIDAMGRSKDMIGFGRSENL